MSETHDAIPAPQRDVVICECFARDGLQHEPEFLPTKEKARLVEAFAELGFSRVEATSYSNPKVVPQFSDASEVLRTLPRKPGVFYKATCANSRAVERALADREAGFGANEISVLISASESHSARNLKRSREDQWDNVRAMVEMADKSFRIIGTISVAFGCPFEGNVPPERVISDVERFAALGVEYVAFGDTTGMATPRQVRRFFSHLRANLPSTVAVAHFHDTRGTGLVNCLAALEAGVTHFDSAFGGVGGHPVGLTYGGGYTGNVCTEDLVNLLESEGVRTGIDLADCLKVAEECESALKRQLHGRVTRSGFNPCLAEPDPLTTA